jgi:transposase
MKPINLTDEQHRALWQLKRDGRSYEERWRASVILDLGKGLGRAQVAERNDCSISGVDKVLIRFRGGGVEALGSARFGPRKRKLDAAGFQLLDQAMQQSPRAVCPAQPEFDRSLWTLDLLVRYLHQAVGVQVTDDTVRRYLLQLGWTTRAPKLTCRSPDPEYSAKMETIGELREAAEKGGSARRSSCTTTRRN